MRKNVIILSWLFLIFQAGLLKAQNTLTRDPGAFNAISVRGNIRVEISPSETNRIEINTNGTPVGNVIFEVTDGELSVGLEAGTPKDAEVDVKIYFIEINRMGVASKALIQSADTLKADIMNFEAKTGGKIELKLNLNELKANISQAGLLVLYGKVRKQEVEVTSTATYSAYDLVAGESYVNASTGGIAKINSTILLDATAKIQGFIGYKGNPSKKSVNTSLGGKIVDYSEE